MTVLPLCWKIIDRITGWQEKSGKNKTHLNNNIMELADLTEKIIGCAFRVYNTMGSGFLESVYHKSLHIELEKSGLESEIHKAIKVFYDKHPVGDFVADIIVNQQVVVELKALQSLNKVHEVQLVNYLKATGLPVGLLINFGEEKIEIKRKVKELKPAK
jgi:GxxExxY protein